MIPMAYKPFFSMGTSAFGINSAGVIVGHYWNGVANLHGFIYSDGSYSTLDYPNATRGTSLAGINDYGVIAGTYQDAAGTHGFIGTPIAPTPMVSHIGNFTQGQPAAMYTILV